MSSFSEKQKKIKEKAAQEAIYEATIKLISEGDGQGLKMQAIADAAGIATGTLYNYFKNKVNLLYFVDRQLHILILGRLRHVADSTDSPTEKLKNIVCETLGFCRDYHGVFDLTERFGIKASIPKEEKSSNLAEGYHCIKRILEEGIKKNDFKPVDSAATAELFFSTIIGVIEIQDWLQDYNTLENTRKLTNFFLAYLQKQES